MQLSDVQHQPIAHERIQLGLASGRVPHAYLFAGPSGVGREMMAIRLARLLLCQSPCEIAPQPGIQTRLAQWRDACGQCEDCRLFEGGGHPDFHRIYRTLNKFHPDKLIQKRKAMDISVDVIRHFLLDCIGLSPSRQCAKVFVIAEAERLSPTAQNAMLKTLEEPPGHSYLILIATSADDLLATTRSRCHLVQFNSLPVDFVREALIVRARIDEAAARFLAEMSQGSLGLGLDFARRELFGLMAAMIESLELSASDPLAASKVWQDLSKSIAEDSGGKKEDETSEGADEEAVAEKDDDVSAGPETRTLREGQLTLLVMLSTILRDIQRVSVGHAAAALPQEQRLAKLARGTRPRAVASAIRTIAKSEEDLELNANAALIFDAQAIAIGEALSGQVVSSV